MHYELQKAMQRELKADRCNDWVPHPCGFQGAGFEPSDAVHPALFSPLQNILTRQRRSRSARTYLP